MSRKRVFADRVKALRVKKHLTQEELAEGTGYSQQQVARWEGGKHIPLIVRHYVAHPRRPLGCCVECGRGCPRPLVAPLRFAPEKLTNYKV